VFSGGNTTIEAIMKIFAHGVSDDEMLREEGVLGRDGRRDVENVAG
jgi:threonine dehydratase